MINDFFQPAKVQRKIKGRKRYTLNNVNRQKITSRMLEDEALGFCYALQCYSSQNENRYPSPMAPENKYKEASVTPTFCEKTWNFQFYSLYLSPYC